MRYWLIRDNELAGPYDEAELRTVRDFSEASLVCADLRRDIQAGNWRRAEAVAELGDVLSHGAVLRALRDGGLPPDPTLDDMAHYGALLVKLRSLEDVLIRGQEELRARGADIRALRGGLQAKERELGELRSRIGTFETRLRDAEALKFDIEQVAEDGLKRARTINELQDRTHTADERSAAARVLNDKRAGALEERLRSVESKLSELRAAAAAERAAAEKAERARAKRRFRLPSAGELAFIGVPALLVAGYFGYGEYRKWKSAPVYEAPVEAVRQAEKPVAAVSSPAARPKRTARPKRRPPKRSPKRRHVRKRTVAAARPPVRPYEKALLAAKEFQILTDEPGRCPAGLSAIDQAGQGRWPQVRGIDKFLHCSGRLLAWSWVATVARRRGISRSKAAAWILKDIEKWGGLAKLHPVVWSIVWEAGNRFAVKAVVTDGLSRRLRQRYSPGLPMGWKSSSTGLARPALHSFRVDMQARTIRPLNLRAWSVLAPRDYHAWVLKRVRAGNSPVADLDFSEAGSAPAYPLAAPAFKFAPPARAAPATKKPVRARPSRMRSDMSRMSKEELQKFLQEMMPK